PPSSLRSAQAVRRYCLVKVLLGGENGVMFDKTEGVSQDGGRVVVIPSDPAEARQVQEDIEAALKRHQFEDREIFSIKLALEEALVNAIKHGNQLDRGKRVHIAYRVSAERFEVRITDEGPGFDPDDVPDPMAVENLERPCG